MQRTTSRCSPKSSSRLGGGTRPGSRWTIWSTYYAPRTIPWSRSYSCYPSYPAILYNPYRNTSASRCRNSSQPMSVNPQNANPGIPLESNSVKLYWVASRRLPRKKSNRNGRNQPPSWKMWLKKLRMMRTPIMVTSNSSNNNRNRIRRRIIVIIQF